MRRRLHRLTGPATRQRKSIPEGARHTEEWEGLVVPQELGCVYIVQGHPQEALAEMEKDPEPVWRIFGLALAYHALGKKEESDAALKEFIAKYRSEGPYDIAQIYAFRGEADEAFRWLQRAYAERDPGLQEVNGDPLLKNLRSDPRYVAFLKKIGLHA